MIKRIIVCFLALISIMSCVACDNSKESNSAKSNVKQVFTFAKDSINNQDLFLVKDSYTDYKIVLSKDASDSERKAGLYLQDVIKNSTNSIIPIIESDVSDNKGYYISIGDTKLLESSNISFDKKKLNKNGFLLAKKENSILIKGASEAGNFYGVQELLSYLINYKVYATDEVYYDRISTVRMLDIGCLEIAPSISLCSPGAYHAGTIDESLLLRSCSALNFYDNSSGPIYDSTFIYHSILKIAPKDQYPQWYTGNQICYSQPEIISFVAEKIVERMKINPETVYLYQLGNADDPSCCSCKDCIDKMSLYGGAGGSYVVWLNKIAKATEELMIKENIEKDEWYLVGLMYQAFAHAPVEYNKKTNSYEPISKDVICDEHVGVQYAPVSACHAHPFSDESCQTNVEGNVKKDFYGWAKLTDFYTIWSYNTEWYNSMFLFDDFGSFAQNIKDGADLGVKMWMFERQTNTNGPYDKLRTFVMSQLCWNANLDYNQLVNDFFDMYYKEASEYMKSYFDIIRANMQRIGNQFGNGGCITYGTGSGKYFSSLYWGYNFLNQLNDIIDDAYLLIEQSGYNAKSEEELRMRIRAEEMFCTAYFVNDYKMFFKDTEYNEMRQKFVVDCHALGYKYLTQIDCWNGVLIK